MMNGLKQYSQWHPELRSGFRLLLIVCLGLGAWVLWQEQALWSKKLVASQQELQQISALSLKYEALGGLSTAKQSFSNINQAAEWLMSSGKQQGVAVQINIIEGQQLQANIKQAHFNRVMQWLQLQSETNLALVSNQLTAGEAGIVSGFMIFKVH